MLFIDENKGVFTSPEVHDVYKGEFLALRAFLHFDILRLFAPSAAMNNNKGLDALAIPYIDVFNEYRPVPVDGERGFEKNRNGFVGCKTVDERERRI